MCFGYVDIFYFFAELINDYGQMHALTRPSREGGNLLFNTSDDHIIASCCPILKRFYHESRCPVCAGHADATKKCREGSVPWMQ